MNFSSTEKKTLQNMLNLCNEKFGDFSHEIVVCANGCDACTGGCTGHGASVWSTCDVK